MKNLLCTLILAFLIFSMGSCIHKPVATENPANSSSIEETLDVGGATYRFPDDTPVQWLIPFPDKTKPVSGSLESVKLTV